MEIPVKNNGMNHGFRSTAPEFASMPKSKNKPDGLMGMLVRYTPVVLVSAITVLLIAFILLLSTGGIGSSNSESKYVDTSKLQAVFLNTGQVYFGNVKTLNNNYLVMGNIYYLQTQSATSTSKTSVSLVKLGCELHEPYDQMIINRSQVTFWENLQDNGQVAKAVAAFEKANPNGQKCTEQTTASDSTTGSVQNAANGSSSTSTSSTTTH